MPQEVICPHCQKPVFLDEPPPLDTRASLDAGHTIETVIPGTMCTDDHRNNGVGGETSPSPSANGTARPIAASDGRKSLNTAGRIPPNDSIEYDPLESPVPDPVLEAFVHDETAQEADLWKGNIAIDSALSSKVPASETDALDEDDGAQSGPRPWLIVLLSSYASAATIVLAYLLWNGIGRQAPPRSSAVASSQEDPIARSANLPALPEDRLARLGKSLTIGDLEITPIEVRKSVVRLNRVSGSRARWPNDPKSDSLLLKLRLKNLSKDTTFAPLEPAFVRNSDAGSSESLIQSGGETIETYPLAVASESPRSSARNSARSSRAKLTRRSSRASRRSKAS